MAMEYDPSWMEETVVAAKPVSLKIPVTHMNLMQRTEKQILRTFGETSPHARTVKIHWTSRAKTVHADQMGRVECILHHGMDSEVIERAVACGVRPMHKMTFGMAIHFNPVSECLGLQIQFVTPTGTPMIYENYLSAEANVQEKVREIVIYLSFLMTIVYIYDLCQALHMILPGDLNVCIEFPYRPNSQAPFDPTWNICVFGKKLVKTIRFTVDMVRYQRVNHPFITFSIRGWEGLIKETVFEPGKVLIAYDYPDFDTHFYALYSFILQLVGESARVKEETGAGAWDVI